MRPACPREDDVLRLLSTGEGRVSAEPALAEHVHQCRECRDLLEVAGAVAGAAGGPSEFGPAPSAGQVWWRAQVRARAEARTTAERPITIVTAVAAAAIVGLVIALGALFLPQLVAPAGGLSTASIAVRLAASPLTWLALGAWALLAPTVLYLALRE
jgi:hypothetical protein